MSPITVTIKRACEISGLGVTTLYKLIDSGKLAAIKIGKRRLIRVDSLEALLAPAATPGLAAERGRSTAVNGGGRGRRFDIDPGRIK